MASRKYFGSHFFLKIVMKEIYTYKSYNFTLIFEAAKTASRWSCRDSTVKIFTPLFGVCIINSYVVPLPSPTVFLVYSNSFDNRPSSANRKEKILSFSRHKQKLKNKKFTVEILNIQLFIF